MILLISRLITAIFSYRKHRDKHTLMRLKYINFVNPFVNVEIFIMVVSIETLIEVIILTSIF